MRLVKFLKILETNTNSTQAEREFCFLTKSVVSNSCLSFPELFSANVPTSPVRVVNEMYGPKVFV